MWTGKLMLLYQLVRKIQETHSTPYFAAREQATQVAFDTCFHMIKPKITQSRFGFLPTVFGIALASLGLTVLLGWLLHVRAMVEIRAGYVAMVFNTALCFALTGSALALPGLLGKPTPKFQALVGGTIFILCAMIFTEHLFDTGLGIDWAFLHTWLADGNIRPGRLVPNIAIGFMLIGATLILMNHVSNKWQASAVQILTFGVLAIDLPFSWKG